jgi:AraC-like DNA-binding protein/uncharacterized phosphosugar-binding protein
VPVNELLRVLDHINTNFTGDLRLRDVAVLFGFGPSHLTRLLKKETGLTFLSFVRSKRLALSKELLGRMSVTEACFEVGFESLPHFSRMFKRRYGVNPSEYKRGLYGKGLRRLLSSDEKLDHRCLGQKVVSFVEQYYQRILEILAEIKALEMDQLRDIADRCILSLEKGHRILAIAYDSEGYLVENYSGGPRSVLASSTPPRWYPIRKWYDPKQQSITIVDPDLRFLPALSRGDMLITAVPFLQLKEIAGRGAEVVGLAGPFFGSHSAPKTRLETGANGRSLEDLVGRVVDSRVPAEDGLVCVPEIPAAPFAPGSSVASMFVRSIFQAGMAEKVSRPKAAGDAGPAKTVLEKVNVLSEHSYRIKEIGAQMAEKVVAGGKLYLGGKGKALNEFIFRGAGLMGLRSLSAGHLTEKDVAVIDASSGLDFAVKKIAPLLRARGIYVVTVFSGHGLRPCLSLSDSVHDLMDQVSGEPGKLRDETERRAPPFPDDRIYSWVLLWMLFASYLQEMVIRGRVPFVFRGFHLAGGKKYNEAVYPLFLERGH